MINYKDISKLLTSNFSEINFILWVGFILSIFFSEYLSNFIEVVFEFFPNFLKDYFLNIYISPIMLNRLYLSLSILVPLPIYIIIAQVIVVKLGPFIFKENFEIDGLLTILEKFGLIFIPALLIFHILNITINLIPHDKASSLIMIDNHILILGKWTSGIFGFFILAYKKV